MDYFQTIKTSLDRVDSIADSGLNTVFSSKWSQALLYLLIILYATKFAPTLPRQVMDLVDNQFFKIFVFFMVIWSAKHSPTTALVISIAFLITMNYVNNVKMFEKMESDLKEQVLNTELSSMQPALAPQVAEGEVVLPPVVVEPKVVTTTDGTQMVVTPQVIVASKQVSTPSGETVLVTPEVTQLPAPAPAQLEAAPAPAAAPAQLEAAPAPAAAPAAPEAVPAPEEIAAAPSVQEQAPAPTPAAAEKPKLQPYSEACFVMQSYDMSKVSGLEQEFGYATV